MRRIPVRYLAAGAGTALLALALSLSVGRIGGPAEGMTAEQLQRIEARNREAARQAAAVQRRESRVGAEAADQETSLREAEQRGETAADAMLARFQNEDLPQPKAPPKQ